MLPDLVLCSNLGYFLSRLAKKFGLGDLNIRLLLGLFFIELKTGFRTILKLDLHQFRTGSNIRSKNVIVEKSAKNQPRTGY